ncbi:MAG: alpha/beta hydrolase [Burkholderiaceae bacterium]|nr:MAG: alpha/beta hydrolase [Burkholderiaceae bacterium]
MKDGLESGLALPEKCQGRLRGHRTEHWRWPAMPGGQEAPMTVLLHGWMDGAASFLPLVTAWRAQGHLGEIRALNWRGFGGSWHPDDPQVQSYWYPDYLGDLDAFLGQVAKAPVTLVGHSLGGNVASAYAALRPQRVSALVNVEGFGLPDSEPAHAPDRLVQWLDSLQADEAQVAWHAGREQALQRWGRWHPRVSLDRLRPLLPHFVVEDARGVALAADPAHKRVSPVLYRKAENLALWRRIECPVLWIQGQDTDVQAFWRGKMDQAEVDARLAVVRRLERACVAGAAHMVQLEQPGELASRLGAWLSQGPA